MLYMYICEYNLAMHFILILFVILFVYLFICLVFVILLTKYCYVRSFIACGGDIICGFALPHLGDGSHDSDTVLHIY